MKYELGKRNDALSMAQNFVLSSYPDQRAFGLEILCRFGVDRHKSDPPFFENCVNISIQHLQDQPQVVSTAATWALRQLGGPRACSALIQLRTHADPEVRLAVAIGIGNQYPKSPEIIETWLGLMDDPDKEVRDWATFGVGTQLDESSPAILIALLHRVDDPYENAREEAIWGLARRGNVVGLAALVEKFETEVWVNGDRDAACEALKLNTATPEELLSGLKAFLAH